METERKSPQPLVRNVTAKVAAAVGGAAAVVVAVIRQDRDRDPVAADRRRDIPRRMTSRYRRKKTASRRNVTTVRIRNRRARNRIAAVACRVEKAIVAEGVAAPAPVVDATDLEVEKITPDPAIGPDHASGLARGIGPVRRDAGPDRPGEAEDETIGMYLSRLFISFVFQYESMRVNHCYYFFAISLMFYILK